VGRVSLHTWGGWERKGVRGQRAKVRFGTPMELAEQTVRRCSKIYVLTRVRGGEALETTTRRRKRLS